MKEMQNPSVQCQHCLSGISNDAALIRIRIFTIFVVFRLRPRHLLAKGDLSRVQVQFSGTMIINLFSDQIYQIHAQHLRLSKLELESLLQHELRLIGNVATKRLGDLRQPDHHLRQQDNRATQTKVPKLHGRQRTHIFARQGALVKYNSYQNLISLGPGVLQRLQKGHCHCEHLLRGSHRIW